MARIDSDWSMRHLWPVRTRKLAAWSERVSRVRMMLDGLLPPVKIACALMLLVLVTLLVGCATPSPPSVSSANPQPPRLSEPIPTESYSEKAQQLINSWRNAVTGM